MEHKGIEDTKAGDKVYLVSRYGISVETVARITATRIFIRGRDFYRFGTKHKGAGLEVSSSEWDRDCIFPITPENTAEFEKWSYGGMLRKTRREVSNCASIRIMNCDFLTMRKVCDLLELWDMPPVKAVSPLIFKYAPYRPVNTVDAAPESDEKDALKEPDESQGN